MEIPSSIPDEYLKDDWEDTYIHPCRSCNGLCCCYICGYQFCHDVSVADYRPIPYGDADLPRHSNRVKVSRDKGIHISQVFHYVFKDWWLKERMILYHAKTSTYQLSSSYRGGDYQATTLRIPLQMGKKRIHVSPTVPKPAESNCPASNWVGYIVHDRCWELLLHHELGTIAERDLSTVVNALRQRRMRMGSQCKPWRPEMDREDPVRTKCVSDAVSLALAQEKERTPRTTSSRPYHPKPMPTNCKLPMEILYMICAYLPSQTVANTEEALSVCFSDHLWHSRISADLFFEVQDIPEKKIDWRMLCLKLEEYLESSEALRVRRYLLNCLDRILAVVKMV